MNISMKENRLSTRESDCLRRPAMAVGFCVVLAMTCFGCATGVASKKWGSGSLPTYPSKSVSDLQAEALIQLEAGRDFDASGFVVVGRLMKATDGGFDGRWLLVNQEVACCVAYEVALPLTGKSEGLTANAWVAVYGRLQGAGESLLPSNRIIGGRNIALGKANATITVEQIVPAERVLYGDQLLELLKSDTLSEFRELLQDSGLEATLRAAEELTLFVPHNRALAGGDTPKHDPESSTLRHFVLGHFAEGRFGKKDLLDRDELVMLNGDRHDIEWVNGKLHIGGARVIMPNLSGNNGIAHIILPALPVSDASFRVGSPVPGGHSTTHSHGHHESELH